MARYAGFDYVEMSATSRTRTEWRDFIAEMRSHGGHIRTDIGETFVYRHVLGTQPELVAEIYATPSQLGVRHDQK